MSETVQTTEKDDRENVERGVSAAMVFKAVGAGVGAGVAIGLSIAVFASRSWAKDAEAEMTHQLNHLLHRATEVSDRLRSHG